VCPILLNFSETIQHNPPSTERLTSIFLQNKGSSHPHNPNHIPYPAQAYIPIFLESLKNFKLPVRTKLEGEKKRESEQ